jgi:hypothetical protein
MIVDDGLDVRIEKPYMVVAIEAKRGNEVEYADSQAQLAAQIRSLQVHW